MLELKNPLETVADISKSNSLDVDTNQSNRYCIRLNSPTGKEAYYFSTPIYNEDSCKLIHRKFIAINGYYHFVGSNCEVIVTSTQIKLINKELLFSIQLKETYSWTLKNGWLISNHLSIAPTYNGIYIEGHLSHMIFDTVTNFEYQRIRSKQDCISFMGELFNPFVVASALFCAQKNEEPRPLKIKYNKDTTTKGSLSFSCEDPFCNYGACEINFYESKLIQDTPVSAKYPLENNAFGPIAFIGKSSFYGTQWLYTRLDIGKLIELHDKYIREVKLYIPCFMKTSDSLNIFGLYNRFCSFGSTWNNKVAKENMYTTIKTNKGYTCIDLSQHYIKRGHITESAGLVITPAYADKLEYQAISTGDSYVMPPVIYVKFSDILRNNN